MCWPPLPLAPIGLESQTMASGSCDQPNLWTLQLIVYVPTKRIKSVECILTTVASIDSQSGALWEAIPQFPQSPLPVGILG
ncbi:hypothetical protein UY3_07045 [Chelonia mydas]|uniref:Uncharacterized protein n=1 Tax=Chelonia mydas TaxID=8469 RepID=M7BUS2_CHEMY|nr:hypothetical protein UY3_07045 [Chelonia mydas]